VNPQGNPIDVWDSSTFDEELNKFLEPQLDLIRNYLSTDRKIFLEYDLGSGPPRPLLRPSNPFAEAFVDLQEAIDQEMESRTIRAFHYTRLTDHEVTDIRRYGVHLSTPETLRRRLEALISGSDLSRTIADKLYAQSPFHSDQFESRSGKFWMVSHPVKVDDSGVTPLMMHWGGEVASMWAKDRSLLTPLSAIGKPRVLEVAVPLSATRHSFSAGKAVLATFARSRGCIPEKQAFDLYAKDPLPPSAILAVHTEDDRSFLEMGESYPAGYVDVGIGRWKELTGEDD
jgi:hypothetical protein